MPILTIDHVLQELDNIIAVCEKQSSRQAYFAALYKAMTESVKNGIASGLFEDSPRMEKLDVIFAKRYIDAWHCYQQSQPCSKSWQTALDACKLGNLTVIQHLILGINTHINLDLAIAAAETAPGESIHSLQTDFEKINGTIAALTNEVQYRLEKIWWPMKLLGKVVNGREKAVVNFSISTARKASWSNAVSLATFSGHAATNYIGGIDNTVDQIAKRIIGPGVFISLLLKPVKWFEYREVNKITTLLKEPLTGKELS